MALAANDFVIDDNNFGLFVDATVVDGHTMGRGLIERDYQSFPQGCYSAAPPFSIDEMPLIPRNEWPERIAHMEASESRLSDIRRRGNGGLIIPSLDQNGQGYCWFYSATACVQLLRARSNSPYVALSGHSGACVIKNFRDQGGWGAAALDFIRDKGIVPQSLWPAKSMSRANNTPENWEKAKEFRVTEAFVDLQPAAYDRSMTLDQVVSCLLNCIPVIGDFNWWGHSVCIEDVVDVDSKLSVNDNNRWGTRILNSWTDNWGTLGEAVLKGKKAIPNGGAAPRVSWGG